MDKINVILSAVVGSNAYGLAHANSDIDRKGVFLADLEDVLGLDVAKVVDGTKRIHESGDNEYYELGKFIKLALKVNPTVTEILWLKDYEFLTDYGKLLIAGRYYFLSEPAIRGAYGAYAKSQADRLVRRMSEGKEGFSSDVKGRTQKHGRHCMRLLLQGIQFLKEGQLQVDVSDKRDWLFDMGRLAEQDPLRFYQEYTTLAYEFDNTETKLPEFPDREMANLLCRTLRLLSS